MALCIGTKHKYSFISREVGIRGKVKCNKMPSFKKDKNKTIIASICKTRLRGSVYRRLMEHVMTLGKGMSPFHAMVKLKQTAQPKSLTPQISIEKERTKSQKNLPLNGLFFQSSKRSLFGHVIIIDCVLLHLFSCTF